MLTEHLSSLLNGFRKLRLHAIGHSAGSIILGEILELLAKNAPKKDPRAKLTTCTLWAPACTMQFALKHYKRAVKKGVLDPGSESLAIENLSDERERADSTGPYNKSILYLVSRALEDFHKTPLLGLQNAWQEEWDEAQPWAEDSKDSVRRWREFADKHGIKPRVVRKSEVSNGVNRIPSTHGNFDNDVEALTRAIKRIRGKLNVPIENLADC